ncbi:hypothetical protein PsorP6_006750 [Peronosclerospora sorghi]|uniref:Uncharacterized protein n=1 Tax=Peronosclerospora sorghi TaxID=230839 RepID=A0ACC0W419_9STRA|nr:hypothetical protein PsorP6_006750 [Peronosclerospora sorghi]
MPSATAGAGSAIVDVDNVADIGVGAEDARDPLEEAHGDIGSVQAPRHLRRVRQMVEGTPKIFEQAYRQGIESFRAIAHVDAPTLFLKKSTGSSTSLFDELEELR